MTLSKKAAITVTGSRSHPIFHSYFVSMQKIKNKTGKTMAPSYHSKVSSNQIKEVLFLSCFDHGVKHYLYLPVWVRAKFFQ